MFFWNGALFKKIYLYWKFGYLSKNPIDIPLHFVLDCLDTTMYQSFYTKLNNYQKEFLQLQAQMFPTNIV